jgi:hypothetical protein
MTILVVAAVAVVLVLVLAVRVLRRRPHRAVEAAELSAYHDGLDALTRLEAQRAHPD